MNKERQPMETPLEPIESDDSANGKFQQDTRSEGRLRRSSGCRTSRMRASMLSYLRHLLFANAAGHALFPERSSKLSRQE